ncbi:MAG: hypothetical protein ACOCWT_02995 [Desulfohalobiaceae bacterium]
MADQKSRLYEELSENLRDEVLQEAADTLFGKRRAIEQEISLFYDKVEELRKVLKNVQLHQKGLHFLLLDNDPDAVAGFYRSIGVDPGRIPEIETDHPSREAFPEKLPFAFTAKGRYAKGLFLSYGAFARAVAEYLSGRTYNDPDDPRVKRVTVNRKALEKWHGELNRKIEDLNRDYAPSRSLDFAKRLDVEQSEKADKMACTLSRSNLDEDMAFPTIDWGGLNLPDYPELPPAAQVKATVRSYAAKLFAKHPGKVREILDRLRKI